MILYTGTVAQTFQTSNPFLIVADRATIDMTIVTTGAGELDWFLEFTSGDPNNASTGWFREVSEDDAGSGVVHMPEVVRDYQFTGAGTDRRSAQFIRSHRYVRIQFKQTAAVGIASLMIEAPFGIVTSAVS